jgi:hypothetical protein
MRRLTLTRDNKKRQKAISTEIYISTQSQNATESLARVWPAGMETVGDPLNVTAWSVPATKDDVGLPSEFTTACAT